MVVFVRHALPGERVRAVVTSATARFARADAVEILVPAPGRVSPPCPYAGPGGCGGCDWQHASLPVQRDLKARVIADQLRRLAGVDLPVTVEPLGTESADSAGLGWRTRVRFAVGHDGTAGLYRHRSHDIVPVTDCLIAHPLVRQAGVTRERWPGARWVDVAVAPGTGQRAVLASGAGRRAVPASGAGRRTVPASGAGRRIGQPRFLTQQAVGRDWRVAAAGFWQVHPLAADTLAAAVLDGLAPRPGERALDLYCGSGLFAGVLAEAVGPGGAVIALEQHAAAVRDARHNLRQARWARVHHGDAAQVLADIGTGGATVAVLDPPRCGADRGLLALLCGAGLRRIAYVSCDPATLARDIAVVAGLGWRLDALRAFDAFPMTHHVECVAFLAPQVG